MKKMILLIITLFGALGLAACNDPNIKFTHPVVTLALRETKVLELKLADETAEVTWTSSVPQIASVDDEGKVTAIRGGKVTIRAEIAGGHYDECLVIVSESLSAVKRQATQAVRNYVDGLDKNDYTNENWATIKMIETVALAAFDTFTDEDEIIKLRDQTLESIMAVEKKALTELKKAAKESLDAYVESLNEEDYDATNWVVINILVANGKTQIDQATTEDEVNTIKENTINSINKINPKA